MSNTGVSQIVTVAAREVLDSRGKPTVEVEIGTRGGAGGRAIVPSGASTGSGEALELRDRESPRYDGDGVATAVASVRDILGPALQGMEATDQTRIDARLLELDPTPQKSRYGGNALLGVSLAAAHAGAAALQIPLFRHLHACYAEVVRQSSPGTGNPRAEVPAPKMPLPMTNMISGGLHAGGNLDFQDVLVMPVGAPDYPTGLEWIVKVYRRLGKILQQAGYEGRLVGDEGGYGPRLTGNREAVAFVVQAIEAAGLRPGSEMTIALDVAATHFFERGLYRLKSDADRQLSSTDLIDLLAGWVTDFPITSIEDGLAEDDWEGWQALTKRLGSQVALVGDDLFTTNEQRIRRGFADGVANSVLIKVNQIGTLTETFRAIHAARESGYSFVVSARSGETEDATISDLAVAVAAPLIKIGSIVRSERLAKYNQLLRIDEQLRAEPIRPVA